MDFDPTQNSHDREEVSGKYRGIKHYDKCHATLVTHIHYTYSCGMNDSAFTLKNPPHPGEFIKTEIVDPLGLTVKQAAEVLGITRQALSTFLNAQSDLSPEMAIRLDKAFGVSMETLMRMQCSFDIAKARARAGDIHVNRFEPQLKQDHQPRLV